AVGRGEEALPRPAAAGSHDERRAVAPQVLLDAAGGVAGIVLGCVCHRLLARLALVEHRAAPGAEIRGLRILEPALGAIDVAHTPSSEAGALRDAGIAAILSA